MAEADIFAELNDLTERVIGAAFEVANSLGPGFLEKVYENALVHELGLRGIESVGQPDLKVRYKGVVVGDYSPDILVANRLIIELKCVERLADEHLAQCLNYLKATGLQLALLINFQRAKIEIKRVIRST